jgi:hypothetical protein
MALIKRLRNWLATAPPKPNVNDVLQGCKDSLPGSLMYVRMVYRTIKDPEHRLIFRQWVIKTLNQEMPPCPSCQTSMYVRTFGMDLYECMDDGVTFTWRPQ